MGKNSDYAAQYAEYAMEQMRRYGIPASVTLAQGILESASGQSQLCRNENNHFGIKASKSWLAAGGGYGLYTDDKPNEKFCSYGSAAESYEHHSNILKESSRYSKCFSLSPDDYKGWAKEIDRAGYATAGAYAPALIKLIEQNGLQKYDKMVMDQMRAEGRSFGVEQNPMSVANAPSQSQPNGQYSFPLDRKEFLFVTSPFGNRKDPMNPSQTQFHKGIDISCKNEPLLATENNGKVVAVNENANTPGGKSVTVEYNREDGSKVQLIYCHLSSVGVKVGDAVNAGQQIGISGNTGTRTTGPHLHFGVKSVASDGTKRDIDPAAYLAEIAQRGNIQLTAMYNGKDLLQKFKDANPLAPDAPLVAQNPQIDTSLSPDEWMKKLLSSEDSGVNLGPGGDPIIQLVTGLFTSLMLLATQIDNKTEEERLAAISEAALTKSVDLRPLLPNMKECSLVIQDNGKPMLVVDAGNGQLTKPLTVAELNRISNVLNDSSIEPSAKQVKIAGIVQGLVNAQQASMNFEQISQQSQGQEQQIQR